MTSFQRVAAALSHQEADHVPVYPILCGINRKLVGATYETTILAFIYITSLKIVFI